MQPSPSNAGKRPLNPRTKRTRRGGLALALIGALALIASACTPTINAGDTLGSGQELDSSNGYRAVMETNGQLVIHKPDGTSGWHTQTSGHPGATLTVGTDGNLTLNDTDGTTLFQSNTASIDPVPASLTMQTDGNLVLSAAGQPMWSSAFGADSCYGSGCPVLSTYETQGHGSLAGRDCGYSQQIGTSNQSIWLFCDTPVTPTGGSLGFIPGSTAATGTFHPGFASQSLTELPSGNPHQFLQTPQGLPLKSGGICGTDGHSYAASWATGMTAMPGAPDTVIIPFGNYCVQSGNADAGMWYQGSGIAEYNTTTKALYYQQDLMTGSNPLHELGTPTYDPTTNALYFFGSTCTQKGFGVCTESTTFTAKVNLGSDPATTKPWEVDTNYLFYKGGSTWSPHSPGTAPILPTTTGNLTVSVQRVPALGNQWVMFGMHDIAGDYTILTADSPAGPWTQHSTGRIADCVDEPSGWCYALNVHSELSTANALAITTLNPRRHHVTLEMIPW